MKPKGVALRVNATFNARYSMQTWASLNGFNRPELPIIFPSEIQVITNVCEACIMRSFTSSMIQLFLSFGRWNWGSKIRALHQTSIVIPSLSLSSSFGMAPKALKAWVLVAPILAITLGGSPALLATESLLWLEATSCVTHISTLSTLIPHAAVASSRFALRKKR